MKVKKNNRRPMQKEKQLKKRNKQEPLKSPREKIKRIYLIVIPHRIKRRSEKRDRQIRD